MSIRQGWIDEVWNGWVYGRVVEDDGTEEEFAQPLLDIMESQRVSLQPGSYIYVVNGYIMVNNAIWTTYDMECADREARRLYAALRG